MESISIKLVQPEDFKTLANFGRKTFYETWKEYNTESDMQIYLKEAFNEEKILKDIENHEVNTFLFSYDANVLTGYAKMRNDRSSDEFKGAKALEVERIYVSKQHQGGKSGRMLMDACLEKGRKEAYDWMWLGVNIDNHRAIAFYKKYDFITYGTKMFKLGDAEDQDYLMKRLL